MQVLKNELINLFKGRKVNECMSEANKKTIFIQDTKGTCCEFKQNPTPFSFLDCFKINNRQEKTIVLWAIDNCFIGRGQTYKNKAKNIQIPKKCDCIVFDDQNFCLLELKLDADPNSSIEAIESNRKTALSQLKSTIEILRLEKEQDKLQIEGYKIQAIACFPPTYPEISAIQIAERVAFVKQTGIELLETNQVTFS